MNIFIFIELTLIWFAPISTKPIVNIPKQPTDQILCFGCQPYFIWKFQMIFPVHYLVCICQYIKE